MSKPVPCADQLYHLKVNCGDPTQNPFVGLEQVPVPQLVPQSTFPEQVPLAHIPQSVPATQVLGMHVPEHELAQLKVPQFPLQVLFENKIGSVSQETSLKMLLQNCELLTEV